MKAKFPVANHLKLKLFLLFAFVFSATLGFLVAQSQKDSNAVSAAYAGFNAGNIISDYVMSEHTSMNESAIQNFLNSKNSCNESVSSHPGIGKVTSNYSEGSSYSWHAVNGKFVCLANERFNGESAAHIIYQAAQDYRINPKVLLVLLEKEQSLITDKFPNSVQYRSATGYGCPDTAACDSKYYGFKNQVRNSASFFRYILDNGSRYYPVGNNYVKYNPNSACGGSTVKIQNKATSALYQYTPYQPNAAALNGYNDGCGAFGNRNFYYFFQTWFGNIQGLPSLGTVLSTNRVANERSEPALRYQTHVENYGWLGWVDGGVMSGTAGYSLRTEAFAIKLGDNQPGIEYRAHVANQGWLGYVKDGATAGTTGKSLQMEAIQIRLTGDMSRFYDVYYRVHVSNIGWMDWVKNDEVAGTTGQSKRIEAIQVKLVKKTSSIGLEYRTHVANIGWQNWVKNGALAGTTGQSKRIEAINIKLPSNLTASGDIRYRVHTANIGWMDWVKNGALAGTTGQSRRVEAITIELSDDLAKKYDVYYRAHVAKVGWQKWVKNGALAGTTGKSLQMEAIQIELVAK